MTFKVGDTVYYRAYNGNISKGTVMQTGGGRSGDLTEAFWSERCQALWLPTAQLWDEEPSWGLDELCVCGCTFGDHSESGCVSHPVHRFEATHRPALLAHVCDTSYYVAKPCYVQVGNPPAVRSAHWRGFLLPG
jgi:hypothetical protein